MDILLSAYAFGFILWIILETRSSTRATACTAITCQNSRYSEALPRMPFGGQDNPPAHQSETEVCLAHLYEPSCKKAACFKAL